MRRAAWLAALTLAGCDLAPPTRLPPPPVPAAFPATPPEASPAPAFDRATLFRDPALNALIDRALAGNRDLAVAAANVAAARAQVRMARADLFPTLDLDTGASAGRSGGGGSSTRPGSTYRSFSGSVGVSAFELDLFGRLRNQTAAARARHFATDAGARAVRVALVAEVASTYLTLAADRSLLAIARDTATSADRSVTLTRARLRGGIAARIDLRQAETILNQARADIASLTTAVEQDRNALRLLLGSEPDAASLPAGIEAVDGLLVAAPAGLDSRVLLRRPDIAQAEYELRAANARIGVARAAFFPSISLTGLVGLASGALGDLFTGGAFQYNAGGRAGLPLFDAGRRRGQLAVAAAERDGAVAGYERAIQIAFREVADALARRATIAGQRDAQLALVEAAADTARLTEARYREGIESYLSVLDAQRTLYGARRALVATRLTAADNLVTLYRVLGGDGG